VSLIRGGSGEGLSNSDQENPTEEIIEPLGGAESLVTLRLLMEEGIRRSTDRSPIGRRVAIVILDGAVESAIGLCLDRFGMEYGEKFDDGYARLVEILKKEGRLTGSLSSGPDVKRLRKARNLSQHHGVTPDLGEMPRWAASVLSFIEHAVRATFERDLSLVCLADALVNEGLRRDFRLAERFLAEGDFRRSVWTLADVFSQARRAWDSQLRSSRFASLLVSSFGENPDPTAAYVEDLLSVDMFSLDLGEYVWYQSVLTSLRLAPERAEVTEVDARRAMAFVFGWIVRWEAFAESYVADRLGRLEGPSPQASPNPDGRPMLLNDRVSVEARTSERVLTASASLFAVVPFAAGSDNEPWILWRNWLNEALLQAQGEEASWPWKNCTIDDHGYFKLEVDPDVDPALVRRGLMEVIEKAAGLRLIAAAERESDLAAYEQATPIRDALASLRLDDDTSPFSNVSIRSLGRTDGSRQVVVDAYFRPDLYAAAYERHQDARYEKVEPVGPGRFDPVGVFVRGDAPLEETVKFAEQCVQEALAYKRLLVGELRRPKQSDSVLSRASTASASECSFKSLTSYRVRLIVRS
jgi:hypothetical protein